ncbi:tRNA (guanosine(37)-N1)-methyltransferase TrmD [Gimesia chilikensis]|uniref:tRNA (guanosine(37)-N1)-methyltransferase TrmD n=1 Tax=Gimesia chilikensis TaxID=2605989 RepID=UPI00118A7FDD|nr:tRNA (guanosine(37)-N1)-methyltransferase TrmD [Gimesia chilikensis]QDT84201.1 tRNA (guanine-N(1)-)-methyltransferase [Gimesia chilikensis]
MRFDILTLFPELFDSYLEQGLLKRAIQNQLVEIQRWNFRDWATNKHASVDDRPYGGGPGMLIGCDTVYQCVEHVQQVVPEPGKLIMLTPQGKTLNQKLAQELSQERQLTLLCGRYEGFDERIRIGLEPMEISAGDFITNGGEVPAMLIIETVIRLIPGVLGDESSAKYDSFSESGLLEYPQYTRPQNFRGMEVPEVLLSGNHQEIARWRHEQSLQRTRERRNDLLTESESNST